MDFWIVGLSLGILIVMWNKNKSEISSKYLFNNSDMVARKEDGTKCYSVESSSNELCIFSLTWSYDSFMQD